MKSEESLLVGEGGVQPTHRAGAVRGLVEKHGAIRRRAQEVRAVDIDGRDRDAAVGRDERLAIAVEHVHQAQRGSAHRPARGRRTSRSSCSTPRRCGFEPRRNGVSRGVVEAGSTSPVVDATATRMVRGRGSGTSWSVHRSPLQASMRSTAHACPASRLARMNGCSALVTPTRGWPPDHPEDLRPIGKISAIHAPTHARHTRCVTRGLPQGVEPRARAGMTAAEAQRRERVARRGSIVGETVGNL